MDENLSHSVDFLAARSFRSELHEHLRLHDPLSPQFALHRRLRESGGRRWFVRVVDQCLAQLGVKGALWENLNQLSLLKELKEEGKRRLDQAGEDDPEVMVSAAALYFGAIAALLARPETTAVSQHSSLKAIEIEETLQVFSEVLDAEWNQQILQPALRLFK